MLHHIRRRSIALCIASVAVLGACGSSTTSTSATSTSNTSNTPATAAVTTVGAAATSTASTITVGATGTATTTVTTTAKTGASTTADTAASAGSFPVTIKSGTDTLTITAKPEAIISLSPTTTESLFAIGAGDEVIAVDDQSNYPPAALAKSTKLSGFTPNVEAIAGYKPDLVIVSNDTADGIVAALGKVGIAVLVQPSANTLDDTYAEIDELGQATGHVSEATALVQTMKTKIDTIVKGAPKAATPVTYFHEVDNTLFSATSKTFIGSIYSLFGMQNVADSADTKNTGYPQMSQESLIAANPQIIFLADSQYGESAATVSARPGWNVIAAVKNHEIVETPADIASRWGPRIVDYVQVVADALTKLAA